ncbi:MAG: carbohydrate binding family 9 domain-containing protein, partial [Bacteroidales bacterium]|nr:carbohydrate binding family 9 domain-containing protein [Bacteroidales bacterium]
MKRILIILITLLLLITGVTGQTPEKKQYRATRLTTAPAIDGILDDDAWNEGIWIDDFTQYEPYNGARVSQRTEFKILFDDDNLYGAFKAYDTSPDSIVSRLTRRDNPDGDLVGIIFDSFHDLRTGFLFGITSSGVKYDQMFTNDGDSEDSSWDPNWWVKTSINDEGWVAEMKIPFSQVRFEKNSGDIWGLEVARALYRKNEPSFWQHLPKDAPGLVHLFGELAGLEQIKPRKIFDVTPYTVGQAQTFKAEPGNPFNEKGNNFGFNGGLDAKIGITNNMTMDLTINPDFGQVEADPSQVNLSAYETFFSEKRPFFIEGKNITNFNIGIGDGDVGNDNLFYSRRIGRRPQGYPDLEEGMYADVPRFTAILGAAKLTGKTQDGLSVGFVEAMTSEEKAEIDNGGER